MDAKRHRSRAQGVRRQIAIAALIWIVAANGCKENRLVQRSRAELLLSEIKLRGAGPVSRRIDSDEDFGRTVMDGIASGDSAWLDVAAALQPPSAAAEASLAIALASALTHAPNRVLTLLGTKYPTEEVCGMPFLKADSAQVINYHDDAVRAVESDTTRRFASVVAACRAALDSARSRRLERIDPAYVIKNKPAPVSRRSRRK
jgi:hypothetical protein